MQIIRAYPRHLSMAVELFDQYRQFYQQPSDLAGARLFLAERLQKADATIFLAVEGEGSREKAIGFLQLYPIFSSTQMKPAWLLNDLFVVASERKMGVGRALMERARQFAMETRACELMLQTAVDNRNAQRLYESLGWRRDTEFLTYVLPVTRA